MDSIFQRAKSFAHEAAKRSQELAIEAAKLSQEIAVQTAKRSREIAFEATKKADQIKALAGEISPSIAAVSALSVTPPLAPPDAELQEYGISPQLREFVNGLTIKTFQDFPSSQDPDRTSLDGALATTGTEASITRQDLTEWQERHAVLVLKTVPEISHFRYVLCPRNMKESRFWKIYFTLVKSYIAPYETQASQHAASTNSTLDDITCDQTTSANQPVVNIDATTNAMSDISQVTKKATTSSNDDQELDAYLMGALGSSDEGPDAEDDGFDADFDKLVNSSAIDSDAEEEKNRQKTSGLSSANAVAPSEGSSDGELVEVPSDLETRSILSKTDEVVL